MLYFLLAAIGVVLLLPTGTKKTGEETEQPQETAARPAGDAGASVQGEMEQRLCDALSQMDGVGAVHVVVTLESTGKKIVEKDVPTRSTTEENKKGEETGSVTSCLLYTSSRQYSFAGRIDSGQCGICLRGDRCGLLQRR